MSNSDRRVKEGELFKYRNIIYGWKKYYFRLERSYLHYYEGKYIAEPRGTITRGEISRLEFSKPLELNEFEIHMNSRDIWHLRANSHKWLGRRLEDAWVTSDGCPSIRPRKKIPGFPREERMEWMKILQPNAYIVDPFKTDCSSAVGDQSQPSAPPEQLAGNQCTGAFVAPIYPQLNLPTTSNTMQAGPSVAAGHPNTPPPAYDEINYTK